MTRQARRTRERKLARREARKQAAAVAAVETATPVSETPAATPTPNPAAAAQAPIQNPPVEIPGVAVPQPGSLFPSLSAVTPAISAKQLAANRANAQLSSGPKTRAGLEASSQNRTSHGLARHSGAFRLLPNEDQNGFEALKQQLNAEHQPETPMEHFFVNAMLESIWLADRALKLQQDLCTCSETGAITNERLFTLYARYHSTHARAVRAAFHDLLKLRKETRAAQNGFEAQKRQAEELRLKTERHEMKKQGHYWDLLLKDGKACHQILLNLNQKTQGSQQNPGFEAQFEAELANRGLKSHAGPVQVAVAA